MNITEQITMDLGRKCGDDVAAAMRRTMLLADDRAGAMAVATYGAGYALGTLTGAVAAFLEHEDGPTPELMDQVWTDFLRPLALKQLPELGATPAKATEARRAETGTGSVHDGAVPQAFAQTSTPGESA